MSNNHTQSVSYFKLQFHNITVPTIINAALVSIKDFFQIQKLNDKNILILIKLKTSIQRSKVKADGVTLKVNLQTVDKDAAAVDHRQLVQ